MLRSGGGGGRSTGHRWRCRRPAPPAGSLRDAPSFLAPLPKADAVFRAVVQEEETAAAAEGELPISFVHPSYACSCALLMHPYASFSCILVHSPSASFLCILVQSSHVSFSCILLMHASYACFLCILLVHPSHAYSSIFLTPPSHAEEGALPGACEAYRGLSGGMAARLNGTVQQTVQVGPAAITALPLSLPCCHRGPAATDGAGRPDCQCYHCRFSLQ